MADTTLVGSPYRVGLGVARGLTVDEGVGAGVGAWVRSVVA